MQKLTAPRLREVLHYDAQSGIFTWKIKPNRRIAVGAVAGTHSHGRTQIRVDGIIYRAHRLAWLYMTGSWPTDQIDHKDGNGMHNGFDNLRQASSQLNNQNRHAPHKRNQAGLLGVSIASTTPGGKKYRARIDHLHLGTFATPEEAHQIYLTAKRRLHEGCTI